MSVSTAVPRAAPATRIRLFDLGRHHAAIADRIRPRVERVFASGRFILGPEVERFEDRFAAWHGTRHAVGVSSGTDALILALRALDLPAGGEVITAPNTFFATVEAIVHAGLVPRFADVEPDGYCLDPERVEAAIGPRTAALLPVHLHGRPAAMTELLDLAARHGLEVVEDNAQSIGGRHRGRLLGTLGRVGAFSFFPAKILGGPGDGGGITTDDDRVADRIRRLRDHGRTSKHESGEIGSNMRLDALAAAVLDAKLDLLDGWLARRRALADRYAAALADLPLALPGDRPGDDPVAHFFVVRTPDRDRLRSALAVHGIETGIHYPVPCHLQPALRGHGYAPGDFPEAERFAAETLSLPLFPEMRDDEVDEVAGRIREELQP